MPEALSFVPFEQQAATDLTVAAIEIGAKDSNDKLARAQVALGVSGIFLAAGQGDIQGAANALSTLILNTKNPGLALIGRQVWAIGSPFLSAQAAALAAAPLIGGVVDSALTNTANGMAAAANAYISASKAKSQAQATLQQLQAS